MKGFEKYVDVRVSRDFTAPMRTVSCLAILLGSFLMTGCSIFGKKTADGAATFSDAPVSNTGSKFIVTPDRGVNGKVASVNANLQFVILNFPVGQMPAIGQRLTVYHRGLKSGELKVS